ncbi:MAG: cellobiose phosphorylase, partial [Armatimonadetes bacterium]|nr:cellobiose phosphorylase [Armatimonadota bacterium]
GQLAVALKWLDDVRRSLETSLAEWIELMKRMEALAESCCRLFEEMDFEFLYDEGRDLFVVGYDVADARLDPYHYDLLASECRLASFIAIAKGDVPQKHWFRMGRALSQGRGERALISWGGTMFEYLMPSLVMHAYPGTLLSQTLPTVVRRQQEFATREGVPWGISESGFAARDPQMNYQYRSFGVPGLGLNPDLFDDLVVTPYATCLALAVAPKAAVQNLEALTRAGLACPYGFYEAIDYTPSRVKPGRRGEVVRELMAHHQGMSLVSLANALLGPKMPERFHADPLVKAAELLLEERNPRRPATAHPLTQQVALARQVVREAPPSAVRHYTTAHTSTPRVQLLSNGHYAVMLTAGGGGYSSWEGLALTRWREDTTRDHWGQFIYVRDLRNGRVSSITHHPVGSSGGAYDVYFTEDKAEFERRDGGLIQRLEVAVSSEDNVEVRRVTLTNPTDLPRELEIVSYAEIVLAQPAADQAHPAFSNLFVETEHVPGQNALLATRRPRSAQQARLWAVHVIAHEGIPAEIWGETSYETDRARFLGRGRTPAAPASLERGGVASRSAGPVLDPIFSLRQKVVIGPRQTVQLAFTTGVAASREEALLLAQRYSDLRSASRTFELAWLHSQIELRYLNLTPDQASLCQRLASRLLYVDSYVRAPEEILARNSEGQSGLWAHGISGDLPLVLAQVSSFEHLPLVRELLLAHTYLRRKGLVFDLVLLNEHPPGYLQVFEQALQDAVRNEGAPVDGRGGVFLRRAEFVTEAARNLLRFVARAVFSGDQGPLADQLDWRPEPREDPAAHLPSRPPVPPEPISIVRPELDYFNGLGGFSRSAEEYTILLERGRWTPSPWSNVIANERFGFVASEAGPGFTWSENSRENRLTPWSNDPVSDPPGEALYLRNESTGRYWSVTPLPSRDNNPYSVSHGAGYTRYEHQSHGLEQELLLFVPPEDPVKIYRLRVRNTTERVQELTATFYAEWVLGPMREQTQAYVTTWRDPETGALFARNSYSAEFAARVAFAAVDRVAPSWTADRTEFLGRNGSAERPRAMDRAELAGAAGASLDPCAALRVAFTLQPGASTEVVFMLGQGADIAEARSVLLKYRRKEAVTAALAAVGERWGSVLGAVQVRTPDPAFDRLLNHWLLYQVLACRVWARSAFYQSGGAYGFRDQLQDVMALVTSGCPEAVQVARRQILLHAAHQFTEGDVQHWWHPPSGRGIRTRFSDDLLWLPYVTAHYVRSTGDAAVLDEPTTFLLGRLLADGEDEYYDLPAVSTEEASLYEHCLRAIRRGTTEGEHGLPLIGTGDWNDGMNLIGHHGRGESVWVAWFLIDVLRQFAPLCAARGDAEQAAELRAQAERYRLAVEAEAWDGDWYRRAYFDDGTPLGSVVNEECRIDAIAQSWAVISGAGDPERSRRAMAAVEEHLVREEDGLILLFTPPFDQGTLDPGYIKGYVPGVRENGGQYTHAALWTVQATALLGHGRRAHELFGLLNPIHHAETPEQCAAYRVEPYVVAADVYGGAPHTGRGGWTWYTGSASWMYRIGLETLLGFRREGDAFTMEPCIPGSWPGFELSCTYQGARYRVRVRNPNGVERGVSRVTLDGALCEGGRVPLVADGGEHEVVVVLG